MQNYIGKNIKTGEWVVADNKLVDCENQEVYLIPNLFYLKEMKIDKKSLFKYKVEKDSVGIAVAKDINGKILYCGDDVEIEYYLKKAEVQNKQVAKAIICYDYKSKIYYMRTSDNRIFLFEGDSIHFISKIKRVGRTLGVKFITAYDYRN